MDASGINEGSLQVDFHRATIGVSDFDVYCSSTLYERGQSLNVHLQRQSLTSRESGEHDTVRIALRQKMLKRGDELLTSTLTLGEVLVKPMKVGDTLLASEYRRAIPGTATLLQFDEKAAVLYARLRCDAAFRAPDAIQLACAASFGVDLFITNDERLHGKKGGRHPVHHAPEPRSDLRVTDSTYGLLASFAGLLAAASPLLYTIFFVPPSHVPTTFPSVSLSFATISSV
jgi:predicted nucleic acid-binding protein